MPFSLVFSAPPWLLPCLQGGKWCLSPGERPWCCSAFAAGLFSKGVFSASPFPQRKSKITASRKLLLKVSPQGWKLPGVCLAGGKEPVAGGTGLRSSSRMGCGEQLPLLLSLLTHVGFVVQTNRGGERPPRLQSLTPLCSSTTLGAPQAWDKHSLPWQSQLSPQRDP